MDALTLVKEKVFLGQEFLTWLWYVAEVPGFVEMEGVRVVMVLMGDNLVLGPAQGQEGTRVTVKGSEASLAEARQSLKRGKLVESLRLGLDVDSEEYWLTLDAAHLGISGLKLPTTEAVGKGEGLDGPLLERVAMIQTATKALDGLFEVFLECRLASGGFPAEMREWVFVGSLMREGKELLAAIGREGGRTE